ncbi:hypothetical protein BC936DRAFT_138734 [Jimgerdemannia flammicorona]|uniref:Uncharacterized protein n=1 Tax=Jimgerdemannia flammicorona TaxID=994334 RepID=A0A433BMP0_9FUNG|nr:hypothetical protein BC936DRAFT_138734 [Jimgerdemannia flammicorona]
MYPGGDLTWIWAPSTINTVGRPLMLATALRSRKVHTSPNRTSPPALATFSRYYPSLLQRGSSTSNLVGFSAALIILNKTALYYIIEPFSGFAHTGHNNLRSVLRPAQRNVARRARCDRGEIGWWGWGKGEG